MNILVLDTRAGDRRADLFAINADTGAWKKLRLGYVPEFHFDSVTRELVVVETELPGKFWRRDNRFWLKRYSIDTLKLIGEKQTPQRPMYTGFPGRSTRIDSSPSGRYLFLLESRFVQSEPVTDSVYRVIVSRYDRQLDVLEQGQFGVDSCTVDFGNMGDNDEEVYLHLSCDFPSTVAFGSFASSEVFTVPLEHLAPRVHSPRETCGSWLDKKRHTLFCVTGDGVIYQVERCPYGSQPVFQLDLQSPSCVPLQQIYGGGDYLYVGVAADQAERSLSMASEIWQICRTSWKLERVIPLPFPVMNFVATADGATLVGTSPYERAVCFVNSETAHFEHRIEVGVSPAEVQLVN